MSVKEEAEGILENIQPPLTLGEIDEKTEKLAEFTRSLTRNRIGFYALGMGVGAVTGYFIAKRLLQTKYAKIADEEIAEMRQHYMEKSKALEAEAAKGDLGSIVAERGYEESEESEESEDEKPPMAVQPPHISIRPRTKEEQDLREEENKALAAQANKSPEPKNVFEEATVTHIWNEHEERRRRSPNVPYVIHINERHEFDYDELTLTYYTKDDVLCDERDEVIDPDIRDTIIGDSNLDRFGHGSNDAHIVYVRNDKLGILYEICKSPSSFAEEVGGFSHYDVESYKNLERMRVRERDEQEE